MFDSSLDRLLAIRRSRVSDCWGRVRPVRTGTRHGVWYLDHDGLDLPLDGDADESSDRESQDARRSARLAALRRFEQSERFTDIELATLRRLVDDLSIGAIAEQDGCTRQAVIARLVGNSRGQGGLVKKARSLGLLEETLSLNAE